ncbi:YdeI/OmpD-associated family protein [Aurantibacter sp.]|uniref:YdeI/OmpD-associated family protein n=1 Tax=Aurantibacter sp. TaxID=2807103 RepID=UPI00326588ED
MKSKVFDISITGKYFALHLPEGVVQPFLEKNLKRVKVIARFHKNEITFYGAIQKRKNNFYMMFGKRYQQELRVSENDIFQLQFFEDQSKYGVEMPEEMEAVLQSDFNASEIFESFTAGKKRGLIYGILSYKNSQTKIDKSLILCENLKRGIRKNTDLLKSF